MFLTHGPHHTAHAKSAPIQDHCAVRHQSTIRENRIVEHAQGALFDVSGRGHHAPISSAQSSIIGESLSIIPVYSNIIRDYIVISVRRMGVVVSF